MLLRLPLLLAAAAVALSVGSLAAAAGGRGPRHRQGHRHSRHSRQQPLRAHGAAEDAVVDAAGRHLRTTRSSATPTPTPLLFEDADDADDAQPHTTRARVHGHLEEIEEAMINSKGRQPGVTAPAGNRTLLDDDAADDTGSSLWSVPGPGAPDPGEVDIVTRFLRIVESQHLLGGNCTAGTDLNLGEGVVDRYAQERFRVEADVAVNRANMLTRLWKYAGPAVMHSEYLLHALVLAMVEFDDDIFAAGNCYDAHQYKDYWLFCPFAYRLPEGPILVKDLAVEYKYLENTSEWFYMARKNAERVIHNYNQIAHGFHTYTFNSTAHTHRFPDEILAVMYEDGKWSKPYYDCGGGNIWMLTYTVPFFGYANGSYHFKGTSGIDIDLRRVDIDQCPLPPGSTQLNIFAASDKCKKRTTQCEPVAGLGFRRGSYRCVCRRGFYFPDITASQRFYNGSYVEEEYEKLALGRSSVYALPGTLECLPCAQGCEWCEDARPCVAALNWPVRTALLALSAAVICCLPAVALFTVKYGHVKVVRAASPVLLRVIALGAFFMYCTTIASYFQPNVVWCTLRVWLRELGFSLTYGALMLKTWRISVIFRVRSARAVKITDLDLVKRVGVIAGVFSVFLAIRTLVAPPAAIEGKTAEGLKAYLCRTDWWDHSFTTLEVVFLGWGIRLCIVVRKAPSEFNEARFISMAIYNEFLLSVFLNVSMLFLQSPANPDLLFIILFCHTQLTVTLLLGLIFGSKAYLVFRSHGRPGSSESAQSATTASKFLGGKRCGGLGAGARSVCSSVPAQYPQYPPQSHLQPYGSALHNVVPVDVQEEFQRLYTQLEALRERNLRLGNRHLADKIHAMQEAGRKGPGTTTTASLAGKNASTTSALNGGVVESSPEAPPPPRAADTDGGSPEVRAEDTSPGDEPWRLSSLKDRQAPEKVCRGSAWTPIYRRLARSVSCHGPRRQGGALARGRAVSFSTEPSAPAGQDDQMDLDLDLDPDDLDTAASSAAVTTAGSEDAGSLPCTVPCTPEDPEDVCKDVGPGELQQSNCSPLDRLPEHVPA
ncbi:probable G-protein coupled receptor 158 isoform X2 [Frankliniella occidentalis]|uniref:Probable G-protein coupled receptor 158 isoform X2 n=1 Tax=Frankliniella occidentalis TaxID=133901 RepID=A0A9C6WZQ4_FRAOC|nr:probable G-protein coupled receptor 158 isoform X2 [Frankliniella occidentalis]